jgi:hypothetical protein
VQFKEDFFCVIHDKNNFALASIEKQNGVWVGAITSDID